MHSDVFCNISYLLNFEYEKPFIIYVLFLLFNVCLRICFDDVT